MRADTPPSRVVRAVCESWGIGLGLSSLPDLLGVSKPTFYKMLRHLRSKGLEIRLMPNLQALGYRALLVRGVHGRLDGAVYALDPASMKRATVAYVEASSLGILEGLMEAFGAELAGPFTVRLLVCPNGEVFEAPKKPRARASGEEVEVIMELSESFPGVKEASKRLGLSWQRVASIVKSSKSKGLLLGPLVYWRPGSGTGSLGFIVETHRAPPPQMVRDLLSGSGVVMLESTRGFKHLLVGVTAPRKLVSVLDEYGDLVERVYLAPDFPLQPLRKGVALIEAIKPAPLQAGSRRA